MGTYLYFYLHYLCNHQRITEMYQSSPKNPECFHNLVFKKWMIIKLCVRWWQQEKATIITMNSNNSNTDIHFQVDHKPEIPALDPELNIAHLTALCLTPLSSVQFFPSDILLFGLISHKYMCWRVDIKKTNL